MTDSTDLDELLIAHAAGHLTEAAALVVATHLCLCPESRRRYRIYEALGGLVLDELGPEDVGADCRARLFAALEEEASDPDCECSDPGDNPLPLRPYLSARPAAAGWRHCGAFAELPLAVGREPRAKLRLLRLEPGASVPAHGHEGLELTLVLEGGLCDRDRILRTGDLGIADASIVHAPRAETDSACLCLMVANGA